MLNTIPKYEATSQEGYPLYKCESCKRCTNGYCNYFSRDVIPHYHCCFHHSFYKPNHLDDKYVSPSKTYFYQLFEEEERKRRKLEGEFRHLYRVK